MIVNYKNYPTLVEEVYSTFKRLELSLNEVSNNYRVNNDSDVITTEGAVNVKTVTNTEMNKPEVFEFSIGQKEYVVRPEILFTSMKIIFRTYESHVVDNEAKWKLIFPLTFIVQEKSGTLYPVWADNSGDIRNYSAYIERMFAHIMESEQDVLSYFSNEINITVI